MSTAHLDKTRVIVVGAGAAGLAAASRLVSSGLGQVTILEATSRVGGRIHSVNFNNHSIELGAQWVHGEEGNAVFSIANKRDLVEDPRKETLEDIGECLVDEDGEVWDEELVEKMRDFADDFEDEDEEYEGTGNESIGTVKDNQWKEVCQVEEEEFKTKFNIFKDFYHRYYQNLDGFDTWYDGSFSGSCREYVETEGNEMVAFKSESKFSDVLDFFLDQLKIDQMVRFNSEVTQIHWHDNKAAVTVYLSSGEELHADYVIVTCSLGVLKAKANSLFMPALPANKAKAIETIGFGSVGKIFLEFSEIWWPTEDMEGYGFLHKGSPDFKYTAMDADEDWTHFILGLYLVLHRPNILCFWVSGHGCKKMETLEENKVQEDVMKFLRHYLRKEHPVIPDPVGIKSSSWHSDPFFRGTYSYQSMASTSAKLKPSILAEPVGQRGQLRFAGEATHSSFFSTAHGAVESGWREADQIVKLSSK